MLQYLYSSRIKILVATPDSIQAITKRLWFSIFYLFYWEDSKFVVWSKKGKVGPIIILFDCLLTYPPHQYTKYLNLKLELKIFKFTVLNTALLILVFMVR